MTKINFAATVAKFIVLVTNLNLFNIPSPFFGSQF